MFAHAPATAKRRHLHSKKNNNLNAPTVPHLPHPTYLRTQKRISMKSSTIRTFVFTFFLFPFALSSQTIVHGETLEDLVIRLVESDGMYERLAERFSKGDTTLTTKELSTIYYGSAFQKGFDPYQESRILDAANSLARKDKLEDAQRLLTNFSTKNPGNLQAHLDRAYISYLMEDSLSTMAAIDKYYQLLPVALTSGTGESPDKAFVVRAEADEELILTELGFVAVERKLVQRIGQSFHVLRAFAEENQDHQEDFYFNVEIPLKYGLQQRIRDRN